MSGSGIRATLSTGLRRPESIYRVYSDADINLAARDETVNPFFVELGKTTTALPPAGLPSIALPRSDGSDLTHLLSGVPDLFLDDVPVRATAAGAGGNGGGGASNQRNLARGVASRQPSATSGGAVFGASAAFSEGAGGARPRSATDDLADGSAKKRARRGSGDSAALSLSQSSASAFVEVDETPAPCSEACQFEVRPQPKASQRKSYKNENRYLSPNPISVAFVGAGDKPSGVVRAALADEYGAPLADTPQVLVGDREMPLDADGAAAFSLKMIDTSKGAWLRLRFTLELSDGRQQWLTSTRFRVDTNVRKP